MEIRPISKGETDETIITLDYYFFSMNGVALDVMTCKGEIGNGFSSYKSEYRTYGKKTVTFAIDCG